MIAIGAILAVACGCQTTDSTTSEHGGAEAASAVTTSVPAGKSVVTAAVVVPAAPLPALAMGKAIGPIVAGTEAKVEYFDAAGDPVEAMVKDAKGSVSVHNTNPKGQDNYSFGADGVVTMHQRSYGEDYPAGKWTAAE